MATKNSVNNTFSGTASLTGLTATGTININSTGSSATTINSGGGGSVFIASSSASSITINNNSLSIAVINGSGIGKIQIGDEATVKDISIGSTTAAMTISTSGPIFAIGGITGRTTSQDLIFSNSVGNISVDAASGVVGVKTANSGTVNVGTVNADIPMQFGNVNSTSTLDIRMGSGGLNIGTSGAKTINIGNTTGATSVRFFSQTTSTAPITYPSINITSTTANLVPGMTHVVNSGASLCTVTLPISCAVGSVITLVGFGSGLWIIAQNSGQSINSTAASSTVGVLGTVAAVGRYDSVQIECITADTTWVVKSFIGTLLYV